MKTIADLIRPAALTARSNKTRTSLFTNMWIFQTGVLERYRFAFSTLFMTAQSALGSIACQYLLEQNFGVPVLGLCAAVTMASNAMFIAQAEAKYCLAALYLSVIANLGIIFFAL